VKTQPHTRATQRKKVDDATVGLSDYINVNTESQLKNTLNAIKVYQKSERKQLQK